MNYFYGKISVFLLFAFFCLVVISTPSFADKPFIVDDFFIKNYPPYAHGKEPVTCKTQKIKIKKIQNGRTYHYFYEYMSNHGKMLIILDHLHKNRGGYRMIKARLIDEKIHKTLISDVMVDVSNDINGLIYSAFLNKDNVKDLILAFPVRNSTPPTYNVTFLLSSKRGYSVRRVHALAFSQKLFYDFNTDGKCEFLHLDRVDGLVATGVLGAPNYLVYNILQFTPSTFKFNNRLSRFFPRWLEFKTVPAGQTSKHQLDQYGHLPNDKAAQLPQRVKARFFDSYLAKTTDYNRRTYGYFGIVLDQAPIKEAMGLKH